MPKTSYILTLNGGSSSLKFALFQSNKTLERVLAGKFDRIGQPDAQLKITKQGGAEPASHAIDAPDHAACLETLMQLLNEQTGSDPIAAIGHRIVHGGARFREPQPVTPELIAELKRISPFDPEHLPAEISLIEAFAQRDPHLLQIACFDTAFHSQMPQVAKLLPIPRRYQAQGVQRYGFHGLSYAYLLQELERVADKRTAQGRVILAHLGNGASMAAVRAGKSIDTTMAFTPTAGLVMGTRSGDLDPGLVAYLAQTEGMTPAQFHQMVNYEAGLLGISETSSDVRDLLAHEQTDERAAEALDLFCYQAKKWLGALAAALGGLETLVFSGGIGENAPLIRARIVAGLEFLGLALDPARNNKNAAVISTDASRVTIRVIPTDEEWQIAQSTQVILSEIT
ncbi:MAG: acetate/propionate family kinase [Chloroflexi bacterium]|nr:acetate/propionate family kinase [Chloroflexota bacterium]